MLVVGRWRAVCRANVVPQRPLLVKGSVVGVAAMGVALAGGVAGGGGGVATACGDGLCRRGVKNLLDARGGGIVFEKDLI